jgi:hypothetical protein
MLIARRVNRAVVAVKRNFMLAVLSEVVSDGFDGSNCNKSKCC